MYICIYPWVVIPKVREIQVAFAYCAFSHIFRCGNVKRNWGYYTRNFLRWQRRDRQFEDDTVKLPSCVLQTVCFRKSIAHLHHHTTRYAPLSRLAGPLSRPIVITRVISPSIILSRRLTDREKEVKGGPSWRIRHKDYASFLRENHPWSMEISAPFCRTRTGRNQSRNDKSLEYERHSKDGRKRRIMPCFPWGTQHHQWP